MQGSASTATPSQARRRPMLVFMLERRTTGPQIDIKRRPVLMATESG
jgi:hypothetical protein